MSGEFDVRSVSCIRTNAGKKWDHTILWMRSAFPDEAIPNRAFLIGQARYSGEDLYGDVRQAESQHRSAGRRA